MYIVSATHNSFNLQAEEELLFAFSKCPKSSSKNKRYIVLIGTINCIRQHNTRKSPVKHSQLAQQWQPKSHPHNRALTAVSWCRPTTNQFS